MVSPVSFSRCALKLLNAAKAFNFFCKKQSYVFSEKSSVKVMKDRSPPLENGFIGSQMSE